MIVPTISDVMRNLGEQLDVVIAPALTGLRERSTVTTIRHMMRFVEKRVEIEGQVLFDEMHKLKGLLGEVAAVFEAEGLGAVAAGLRKTITAERDPAIYLGLDLLAEDVGALRQGVSDALVAIRGLATRSDAIAKTHQALRDYISWQLAEEAKIIEPSFVGYGARR